MKDDGTLEYSSEEDKIRNTAKKVLSESVKINKNPRQVAMEIAEKKVEEKMKNRKNSF